MRPMVQVSGRDRRRARPARRLTAAAALVLALGGCADPAADSADDPADEEVVRSSGALADGFEVEPGSGLIGAVFPSGTVGHQAVLRVDGDLQRVFEGYVRQAGELGYPVTPDQSGLDQKGCSDPDDATGDDPSEPFEVECSASGLDLGKYSVSVRGFAEPDGQGYIHLLVQPYSEAPELSPLASDGPVASATDDEVAPELTPETDDPALRVVEGSALVGDPIPSACTTGGYVAVLEVTGELMPVMRGYLEQFTGTTAFTSEGLVGDEDEPRVEASAAGGGTLTALGVAGDPSYVLIDRCND